MGFAGMAKAPATQWSWRESPHRFFGGQNAIRLPEGTWLVASRDYTNLQGGAKTGAATLLAAWLDDGKLPPWLTFKLGGDTRYPGLVRRDGILWVSYDSSHEGKSVIYLGKVKIRQREAERAAGPRERPGNFPGRGRRPRRGRSGWVRRQFMNTTVRRARAGLNVSAGRAVGARGD